MSKENLLITQNVSYSINNRQLFDRLTVSFGQEKTGLVGRNGAGKTTLIRLLTKNLQPTEGSIQQNCTVAYLPQKFEAYAQRSIATVLGINKKIAALKRIEKGTGESDDYEIVGDDWDIVERTEKLFLNLRLPLLPLDRKLNTLSGGEATRVVFASLLLQNPDFLILDEPTNNLDHDSRLALYELIRSFKGGMLIVSHDRQLLSLMDKIVELSPLGVKTYGGNYESYFKQKQIEQVAAERQVSDAKKLLRKTKAEAQQTKEKIERRAKHGKKLKATGSQPKMVTDAKKGQAEKTHSKLASSSELQVEQARKKILEAQGKVEKNLFLDFKLEATTVPKGKVVVDIKDLSFGYAEENPIIENFNLTIIGPKRIAIAGHNGSGKTTLLKLIMKQLQPVTGSVSINVEKCAYLGQKDSVLAPNKTTLDNFRTLNPEVSRTDCGLRLAAFMFRNEDALKLVKNLSGGERLRAELACVLMGERPPQLIILDEPTNNMDIDSIQNIEHAMQNYKGALIVVSHDDTFLKNIGIEETVTLNRRKV